MVDANGILQVSAEDKGTGKAEAITITSEMGRLSEEEIKRMVNEAEEYAEEDRRLRERIESRNGLESYLYNLKNTLEEEPNGDSLSLEDKKELQDMVDEALDWLEDNPDGDKDEYDEKRKEIVQVANPMMRNMYAGGVNQEDDFTDEDSLDICVRETGVCLRLQRTSYYMVAMIVTTKLGTHIAILVGVISISRHLLHQSQVTGSRNRGCLQFLLGGRRRCSTSFP